MKHLSQKIISLFLTIIMLISCVPIGCFSKGHFSHIIASASSTSEHSTYWAMSSNEALNFIGFLYDTSNVTSEMQSCGSLYAFLTGALEKGSQEEIEARTFFTQFSAAAINKHIDSSGVAIEASTDFLISYLTDKAGGDIDDGLASSTLNSVKSSVVKSLMYIYNVADETLDNLSLVKNVYDTITGIPKKVKQFSQDVKAAFSTCILIVGQSKRARYSYVSARVNNMSSSVYSNPDIAAIMDAYTELAVSENNIFSGLDIFNRWNDAENKALLDKFAEYIYLVNSSVIESNDNVCANVIEVHCPTDVIVTSSNGSILARIENNKVVEKENNCFATVAESQKIIIVPDSVSCNIEIFGTDNGTMTYSVKSFNGGGLVREVRCENVAVEIDSVYKATVPSEYFVPTEQYALIASTGEIIKPNYDTQPEINTEITDIVVSEELFEGFSKELIDKVANAMFSLEPIVNIANFNISTDDTVALFSAVSKYYPTEYSLLTKGDFSYKIIFSPSLKCITDIRFYYGEDANLEAFERRTKELNTEIAKIVAQVDGMSDFEKALYIHDYIVLNSEYDLELLELLESGGTLSGELYSEKYSEYSILINGTGICGSYALAYRALMNAAGVECLYLSSQQMNHAWNMVKIDGEWYHVDCCWDDPVPDTFGMARRQYFLRTDEEIMELNHYSWVPGTYQATSNNYSDMPRSSDYTQKFDNGYWYYVSNGNVFKANQYGNSEEIIAESLFPSSISYKNGELYYSKGIYIYRYDVNTGKSVIAAFLHSDECGDNSSKAYIKNLYVDESTESASIYKNIYVNNVNRTVKSNVLFEEEKYSKVTGITISESEAEIELFGNLRLNAEIQSSGSTDGLGIKWTSSNNTVASVNSDGIVAALNVGKTTITAECLGFSAECEVSVTGDGLSGSCGKGNTGRWVIDPKTFCLTISGENAMEGYEKGPIFTFTKTPPWLKYGSLIKSVIIEKGVKNICYRAFRNFVKMESITIPDSVTSIGDSAFQWCTGLKSVIIGNGVTRISDSAFYGCTGLTSITVDVNNPNYSNDEYGVLFNKDKTELIQYPVGNKRTEYIIPNSVTSIGKYAFRDCTGLTSVIIPDSVTSIGNSAFSSCTRLTSIIIPDSVTSIGNYAFYKCTGLTSVTIPDGVTSIGDYVFEDCTGLTSITVDVNNPNYSSDEYGVLFNKDKTELIQYPVGNKRTEYIIPNSVTSIGKYAFSFCTGLTNVIISDSVTSIGNYVFSYCTGLASVTIPDGATSIGGWAFEKCTGLTSITIPDSVTSIGEYVFEDCTGLTSVTIGNGVTSIGDYAFYDCTGLTSITVDVNNPNYSSDEYGVLFNKDKTELIQYPVGNKRTEYIIPNSVTSIGKYAFSFCTGLTNVTIPDSVTSIGVRAFCRCTGLTSITIPDSVTSIGDYVFEDCTGLTSMTVDENNNYYSSDESGVLFNKDKTKLIQYPIGNARSEYDIPNSVMSIGERAFEGCIRLTNITIPNSVTSIDLSAFYDCNNICHMGYVGSSEEWNSIDFTHGNELLLSAEHIHFNFDPETDISLCESTEATCTNNGYTSGEYCIDCETWISGHDVVPAKGHNYELTSSVKGTCNTISSDTYTCTICKESYTKYGDLKEGHSYIETVTEPTCTEIGYTTAVCEICGESAMYDFVPMLGHDVTVTRTDADCTKCAQTEYSCKRCDYQTTIVDEDGGLGEHNISVTKTEATCTEKGSIERVCVTCNQVISSEEIEAKGHVPGEWKTVTEATTDSSGMKEKRCTVCSELLDEEIIPKIPVNASGVSLSETEIEITNKSSHQLNAIISPENADDKTVAWASDDESVATVDENGLVTAVSIGKATITVTTTDGGLTATCKVTVNPREFIITWIADGVETTNAVHEYGTIALPDNPVKEGYTFTGWTPEVPDTMPSDDLIFTATWEANNYDAIFNANGGAWADGETTKTVATDFDSEINVPEAPAKQGYIFSGWTPEVGIMDDINGKEFNAIWIAATDTRYTVETYTMNTLGEYEKSVAILTGETDSSANAEYTVEPGFSLNSENSVLSGNISADNSLVLKVYLDRNKYSFTTVVDGVSESSDYLYGSMISEPAIPSKTGYTFTGWSSEIPETMPANDVTVEAEWQVNSYTVTWITDGTETKTTVAYGAKIETPATPVKAGYEFIGWDNQVPETMPANDLSFTAQFECITTVSIKNNPGTKTIKYGETLKLTAITANMPSDAKINWYVDGVKKGEGETFEVSPKNGSIEITVKIVDSNGNVLKDKNGNEIQDSEKVSVNSGLWQKIVSFFKNLFGINRTVVQAIFKGII